MCLAVPDDSNPRNKNHPSPPRTNSDNSGIEFKLERADVLWELALKGYLSDWKIPCSDPQVSEGGLTLNYSNETVIVTLQLSGELEKLDLKNEKMVNFFSSHLGLNTKLDQECQAVWLLGNGDGLEEVGVFEWNAAPDESQNRLLSYTGTLDQPSPEGLRKQLEMAVEFFKNYLSSVFAGNDEKAPVTLIDFSPPSEVIEEYESELARFAVQDKLPLFEGLDVSPPEEITDPKEEHYRLAIPAYDLRDVQNVAPSAVRRLEVVAEQLNDYEDFKTSRLGLTPRGVIVITGHDVLQRTHLINGLAGELGAAICRVSPMFLTNTWTSFLEDMIQEVRTDLTEEDWRNVVTKQMLVISDSGLPFIDPDHPTEITSLVQISADDLYTTMRRIRGWEDTVVVFSMDDTSNMDPALLRTALCEVSTDFSVEHLELLLIDFSEGIQKRSMGGIQFEIDARELSSSLWHEGCDSIFKIQELLDRTVQHFTEYQRDPEQKIGQGYILLCWEMFRWDISV